LIAELLAGEIARALGLPVPEIVFATIDADLARTEPDPEIQDLIRASAGTGAMLNLALDYLPGAVAFDPLAWQSDAALASSIVWFDAYVSNLDRTPRNANMLVWHDRLWLIDHGAAFYFHHASADFVERATSPFAAIKDHVLLPFASQLAGVDAALSAALTGETIAAITSLIPDDWLAPDATHGDPPAQRAVYALYLARRLDAPRAFAEEADRARSLHV
jgi:hypothetical protein